MAIGGGDKSAVGQKLNSRIAAVGTLRVIHDTDTILAFAAFYDVFVRANPSDPVAFRRADVRRVSEADEEAAVGSVFCRVPVACKRSGQFAWLRPAQAFVVGKNDERVEFSRILPQQHGDLFSVWRTQRSRLTEARVWQHRNRRGHTPC